MILKTPREYNSCMVCFQKVLRLLWLTEGLIEGAETIFETWTFGANFPSASTQRAGCRTQACWATWDSRGKLKFSAGRERGESFKGLVHTPLCSQHGIFLIRALAVSAHLAFQYVWLEVCSTQQVKPMFAKLQTAIINSRRASVGMGILAATCHSMVCSWSMFDTFLAIHHFIFSDQMYLKSR